jgi:hypothetical protein
MSQKELEKSIKAQEFRRDANRLLNSSEKEYVQYVLKEFSKSRNVEVLIKGLLSCLNSPEKLDLLMTIRELLPKSDHKEYDLLAPYKKMAHPSAKRRRGRSWSKNTRTIRLERYPKEPLGFSIRGGKEAGLGMLVSQVDAGSRADLAGVQAGDQIIEVNGINFEWISHESAVSVMKSFNKFKLVLYNIGKLPQFSSEDRGSFIWVKPSGAPIKANDNPPTEDNDPFEDQLMTSDMKKLVINKEPGRSFGLKIRGGQEFQLGIFVVGIDPGSVCEEHGLQVGDQILSVNNQSFHNIYHHEAAAILKKESVLIMTIKSVGRIPKILSKKPTDVPPPKAAEDYEMKSSTLPERGSLMVPSTFRDGLAESPRFSRKRASSNATEKAATLNPHSISPLASSIQRTSPVHYDQEDIVQDDEDTPKFQYGIGTQVMLSSSVYNPIKEQLVDSAKKLLNKDEVDALKRKFADYEDTGKLNMLVQFLIAVLDKPNKIDLLVDIRPLLNPGDLTKFDKLISHHEMTLKNKQVTNGGNKENGNRHKTNNVSKPATAEDDSTKSPAPPSDNNTTKPVIVLNDEDVTPSDDDSANIGNTSIQQTSNSKQLPQASPTTAKNHQNLIDDLQKNGASLELHKVETINEEGEEEEEKKEIEGAFGNPAAQDVLERAKQMQE